MRREQGSNTRRPRQPAAPPEEETRVRLRDGEEDDEEDDPNESENADNWEPEGDGDGDGDGEEDGDGDGEGDAPPAAAPTPAVPARRPMKKAVEIKADDLLAAVRLMVREEIDAIVTPLYERSVDLIKAVNGNSTVVDRFATAHETLTKSLESMVTINNLPELIKSLGAEGLITLGGGGAPQPTPSPAQEEAAPQNAQVIKTTTATPIEANALLNKAGVEAPEGSTNIVPTASGEMTAEEEAEYPKVMSKALALSENGLVIGGFGEVMGAIEARRRPSSEAFQKLRKGVETAATAQRQESASAGW